MRTTTSAATTGTVPPTIQTQRSEIRCSDDIGDACFLAKQGSAVDAPWNAVSAFANCGRCRRTRPGQLWAQLLTHATQQKGDCRMRANSLCHAHLALSPALTAVARCFVLSLDSEQIVTKKAVRLHCHSVPRSGSDTACGRPTATAAPTATIATAAIASVLDLCQMNLMAILRFSRSEECAFQTRLFVIEFTALKSDDWNVFAPNFSITGAGHDV